MTTNGHARPPAPRQQTRPAVEQDAPEYLVIVHPAGDLDAPHLARYWTEVPALSACTGDGATVDKAVESTRQAITRWLRDHAGTGPLSSLPAFRLAVELAF
jgi:predicted RNase H-like HicB family nuclease